MPINILSPEFSFLTFGYEEQNSCDTEELQALPVCDSLKIQAQVQITGGEFLVDENPLYVAIADKDGNVVYDNDTQLTPICSKRQLYSYLDNVKIPSGNTGDLCAGDFGDISILDIEQNPFSEVTTTDLKFKVTFPVTADNHFQLYIEDKLYIFDYDLLSVIDYTVLTYGNVSFVKLRLASTETVQADIMRDTIAALIDPVHGTTTTLHPATKVITIADIPAGSYLNNATGFINSIDTVSPETYTGKYLYWQAGKLYYRFVPGILTTNYNTPTLTLSQSLTSGTTYAFTVSYVPGNSEYTCVVTINDGTNPPTVINPEVTGTELTVTYTALLTGAHTIEIEFTDENQSLEIFQISDVLLSEAIEVTGSTTSDEYTEVPTGNYSQSGLLLLLAQLLGVDSICEFETCCPVDKIEFTYETGGIEYTAKTVEIWQKAYINFPDESISELELNLDCFSYAILDAEKNVIECSNLFRRESDCCYISAIEYYNNEDAFGFNYPEGVKNYINLPFYLHSPNSPVSEKIYKNTAGNYKRLSVDIEKEWDAETDYLHDIQHDKLKVALKHDNIVITSNRLGFTSEMIQPGPYKIDWNNKIDFTASANFKLKKYFNGKNSNCKNSNSCN